MSTVIGDINKKMKISVFVKAGSRKNSVEKDAFGFKVHTTQAPEKGMANEAVIDLLAEYFHVPKSRVQLVRGSRASKKIFEIY